MTQKNATSAFVFQSTPSQRGRPRLRGFLNPHILFQSTPSQRGRHSDTRLVSQYNGISIHALAKRATSRLAEASAVPIISIHALAKRATKYIKKINQRLAISIHALAKRATFLHSLGGTLKYHFNPRPRKEGDDHRIAVRKIIILFQSTPSQRGRQVSGYEGGDTQGISIHALAKRATYLY